MIIAEEIFLQENNERRKKHAAQRQDRNYIWRRWSRWRCRRQAFSREGAHIFLAGRTAGKLETVAAEIHANWGKVEVARVNALDRDTVEAHLAAITEKAGP